MKNQDIVDEVIHAFYEAGFEKESERLANFKLDLMSDIPETRLQAVQGIVGFCHPKAWGDLAVSGKCSAYKSIQDWDRALAKLLKYVKRVNRN